jgi:hypothetical protein
MQINLTSYFPEHTIIEQILCLSSKPKTDVPNEHPIYLSSTESFSLTS